MKRQSLLDGWFAEKSRENESVSHEQDYIPADGEGTSVADLDNVDEVENDPNADDHDYC